MSDTVIKVENLGKKYIIGHKQKQQGLRHALNDSITSFGHKLLKPSLKGESKWKTEEFWALKDVSFEVNQGDVVGIIGRNGAGKSTLLKILSRITEPTTGRISLRGRVASLLEVGTGFHPELTGRENIYLNGAILGMSRDEIRRKFDEIVDFAEVEKFLDTPVKRYSSGMYVRLAFAVAAHLEPEILVVDEVLAVGDIEFQKKCLGKMSSIASNDGRTVLFVSHNMAAIRTLCNIGILLYQGDLIKRGAVDELLKSYLDNTEINSASIKINKTSHTKCEPTYIWFHSLTLLGKIQTQFTVYWRENFAFKVVFEVVQSIKNVVFGFALSTLDGTQLLSTHFTDNGNAPCSFEPGLYELDFNIENNLREGKYTLDIGAHDAIGGSLITHVSKVATVEVLRVSIDEKTHPKHGTAVINTSSSWLSPQRIR